MQGSHTTKSYQRNVLSNTFVLLLLLLRKSNASRRRVTSVFTCIVVVLRLVYISSYEDCRGSKREANEQLNSCSDEDRPTSRDTIFGLGTFQSSHPRILNPNRFDPRIECGFHPTITVLAQHSRMAARSANLEFAFRKNSVVAARNSDVLDDAFMARVTNQSKFCRSGCYRCPGQTEASLPGLVGYRMDPRYTDAR
jgi:hypothetical protein